jgi:hypothetical protein
MDIEHRHGVLPQCTLFQPRLVAPRSKGVVVATAPEVDAFDFANAEIRTIHRPRGNVVGRSDERTDRAGAP